MKRIIGLLLSLLLVLAVFPLQALGDTDSGRPVWITAHHCNSEEDISNALIRGFNAIEVDLRCDDPNNQVRDIYDENGQYVYTDCFFLAHNDAYADTDISVHGFFQNPALHGNQICLVIMDIKTPKYIVKLNEAVHDSLNRYYGAGEQIPYIIYSVATLDEGIYFSPAGGFSLWEKEGVCIDYCNYADQVEALFDGYGYENCWYGNGIFSGADGSGTVGGCAAATHIRDFNTDSRIKKVESWTVQSENGMKERIIDWRCDSVMVDFNPGANGIPTLMCKPEYESVRLATMADDPFEKYDYRYAPGSTLNFSSYDNGTITVSDMVFEGTSEGSSKKPVFYIDHDGSELHLIFENCVFRNCGDKDTNGSCVYVQNVTSADTIEFKNCVIENCTGDCGAFLYSNDHDAVIKGHGTTLITGCHATDEGGAIYIDEARSVSGFIMTHNGAGDYGGAIADHAKNYSSMVENCFFAYNNAGKEGGGFWSEWKKGCISSSQFFENTASDYSELYCDSSSATVGNCTFVSNSSNPIKGGERSNCKSFVTNEFQLTKGNGTAEAPFLIENESDWMAFSYMAAFGKDFSNQYVRLDSDVFVCRKVGGSGLFFGGGFNGTFDGNGHVLKSSGREFDDINGVIGKGPNASLNNVQLRRISGETGYAGSVLSVGSLWIVGTVAAAAVAAVLGLVIFKKKQKAVK